MADETTPRPARPRQGRQVQKETNTHSAPLDALIETLNVFEQQYQVDSEDFFNRYCQGSG